MYQSQHSITSGHRDDSSLFERPRIALFDEKHWFYIRRRYHMTPREIGVAELICQGFSNDEIAEVLKIKHGTVKTHLRNIYRRVRVKSKFAMLLKFVDVATKVSAKFGTTPPIPIADTKKPVEKAPIPFDIPHK